MGESTFKVGGRVRVVDVQDADLEDDDVTVGDLGTVTKVDSDSIPYRVRIDRTGEELWFKAAELAPTIDPAAIEQQAQAVLEASRAADLSPQTRNEITAAMSELQSAADRLIRLRDLGRLP